MVWTQAKAVAVLAAVDASAQGFFASLSQQVAACGPYNFFDIGCYVASSTPVTGVNVFEISNYVPGNTAYYQKSHPNFWGDVPGITNFNATVTPLTCALACQGYGYKYSQLLTNRCTCTVMLGTGAKTTYSSGTAPSCTNARCFGDFDQFCGGASSGEGVKVSADPSFPSDADIRLNNATLALGYKYLGCFNLGSLGFRNNKGATTSLNQGNCYLRCAQEGYPYASFGGGECDCGVSFGPGSYQFNRPADTCESPPAGQGGPGRLVAVNPDLQGCYIPPVPGYGNLDAQSNLLSYSCAADVTFPKNMVVQPLNVTSPSTNKVNSILPVRQRQVGSFYIRGCYSSDMSVAFGIAVPNPKPGVSSLEACANMCTNSQYFGLQNGGQWCACSDTLAIEPDAVDMSVCNRKCASSLRQNCGAGSGPIVYGKSTVGNAVWSSLYTTSTLSSRAGYTCIPNPSTTSGSSSAVSTDSTSATSSATGTSSAAGTSSPTETSSAAGTSSPTGTSSPIATSSPTGTSSAAGTSSPTGTSSTAGTSSASGTSSAAGTSSVSSRTTSPAASSSSASSVPPVVPTSPSTSPNVQTSTAVLQSSTSCGTCAFTASTVPSSTSAARTTSTASSAASSSASSVASSSLASSVASSSLASSPASSATSSPASSAVNPPASSTTSSVGGEVPTTSPSASSPSVTLEPPSITSSATTSTSAPLETVTVAYPEETGYAAAADVPIGEGIKTTIYANATNVDVVVVNEGCYVLEAGQTPFLGSQTTSPIVLDPTGVYCAEFCYSRQYDFNGAIDDNCHCGNVLAPTSPDRYSQIPCPGPNSSNPGRSNQDGQDIVGRSVVHRAAGYLQIFKVLNRARVAVVDPQSSSTTSSVAESTSSLSLGSSTSGAVVGTTSSALGTSSTPVPGGSSTSVAGVSSLSTSSGMLSNSSTASGGMGASSTASGIFGNSSTASGGMGASSTPSAGASSGSGGQSGSLSTPSSGFGLSSTATGFFGNSSTGSGGVRPTTSRGTSRSSSVSGGGGSASSGSGSVPSGSNGGTIITSSSTQYFTVTTGSSGSSRTGPITGSGSMSSIPTGSMGSSRAPSASGSGTSPSGSAVPSSAVFVIQIGPADPSQSGAPGSKARRQSSTGGFVGNAGVNNPVECSQATQFTIIDGELTSGGQRVSTDPGVRSAPLAVRPAVGLISRTWLIVDDELLWVNAAFSGGQATFCFDTTTSRVFFTTTGEGNEPAGCTPIELTPLFVADCPGLNPDNGLLPAEETLILPPGVYFPGQSPADKVCRVTTEYWTIGQFTVVPYPTGS